jgi:hypothetical protein
LLFLLLLSFGLGNEALVHEYEPSELPWWLWRRIKRAAGVTLFIFIFDELRIPFLAQEGT